MNTITASTMITMMMIAAITGNPPESANTAIVGSRTPALPHRGLRSGAVTRCREPGADPIHALVDLDLQQRVQGR